MKNQLSLFLMLASLYMCPFIEAQKNKSVDMWSGTYKIVKAKENSNSTPQPQSITIQKINLIASKELPSNYQTDLDRWVITSEQNNQTNEKMIRRFWFNADEKLDDYKQFGWTDLHQAGKINCVDGGRFFICQTTPMSDVKLGKDEQFFSRTGIFGIWLHHGVVELEKTK